MFPLFISSPTGAACTQDISPSHAITRTLFYLAAAETLTERGRAVSALVERREKRVAIERKSNIMCLSEWRWRVSVWLVNPV